MRRQSRTTSPSSPFELERIGRGALRLLAAALLLGPAAARGAANEPPPVPPAEPSITYVSAGGILTQGLPADPLAQLYLWRAPASGESRLRAAVSVLVNEVRWDRRLGREGPFATVLTLDTSTLPWAQAEVVEGQELRSGELKRGQARVGLGLAWHAPLGPGATFNGLDGALTFEAGALWFQPGSETDPAFVLPRDTFESRLHLRVRADAMVRNDVLLPVTGWSAGLDGTWGVRAAWAPWGDPATGLATGGKGWVSLAVHGIAALPLDGAARRHVLLPALHAGVGSGLDRFSAFRLGNASTWGDHETLSHPVLPGASQDEVPASRYAVVDLEYRLAVAAFTFVQLRGTLAWAEVPDLLAGGTSARTASYPGVTAGVTTGLPWDMALELAGSWSFGLEDATGDGAAKKGRGGLLAVLTKGF